MDETRLPSLNFELCSPGYILSVRPLAGGTLSSYCDVKTSNFKTNGIGCKLLISVREVGPYAKEKLPPKNAAALRKVRTRPREASVRSSRVHESGTTLRVTFLTSISGVSEA